MRTALLAVAFAAALAAAARAAPTAPTIPDCFAQVVAPKAMVLACGDGNLSLEGLTWHGWGTETATATGNARANDCDPYCAAGTFRTYPVSVTASDPHTCLGGRRQYTHLEWSTQAKPPPGLANPAGDMSFPCSWALHPTLSARRSDGRAVLSGKAWTGGAKCPPRVTLTSDGKPIAAVPLTATGTFSYAWRAPAGRHVVVARLACHGASSRTELFEAALVLR